jgi:hypothetical protein
LILDGNTLYGLTTGGGNSCGGTAFKMNTDGSSYQILHSFYSFGGVPYGDLVLSNGILYGLANQGGKTPRGAVFQMTTNGSSYAILHTFGGSGDGQKPYGSPTLSGGTIYGMTPLGGASNYNSGVVFSLHLPLVTSTNLPAATTGTFYSQTLAAVGGTPPYTWSIVSNSLPEGLSLKNSTGQISGIPTKIGTANFSVRSISQEGFTSAEVPLTLPVKLSP